MQKDIKENESSLEMHRLLEPVKELIHSESPAVLYETVIVRNYKIPMRDGTLLDADLFCPDVSEKWPVILIRNPYRSNDILYHDVYAPFFARYGYAVLFVCVRGTLRSEGEWLPFEHEREDGQDVLNWISQKDWCDGNIGTYGASYLGHTQLCIADTEHPMLKTMYVGVYGNRCYETFYHRGMFREDIFTAWAAEMMETNRFEVFTGNAEAELINKILSVYPRKNLGEVLYGKTCSWYRQWISNPQSASDYWQKGYWGTVKDCIENIRVPIFLDGGWFDIFLRAQVDTWNRLPEEIRKESYFLIGPWHHGQTVGGTIPFPGENREGQGQLQSALKWFDYKLKGKPNVYPLGKIEAYRIGENEWKTEEADLFKEPVHRANIWYLTGTGLEEGPQDETASRSYLYDPKDAVPSKGGMLLFNHEDPSGPVPCSVEQDPAGARDDVISFVSDSLKEDTMIYGSMKLHLFVSSTAPATAFTVKVCEVFEDTRTFNIRDDITDIRWEEDGSFKTYEPGEVKELIFDLPPITWRMRKGSKLRIDVSSSNFPAFHVHPNVTDPWAEVVPSRTATQTIFFGGEYLSRVEF